MDVWLGSRRRLLQFYGDGEGRKSAYLQGIAEHSVEGQRALER